MNTCKSILFSVSKKWQNRFLGEINLQVLYALSYLKGKSALLIFDRFANLKYRYGNRHFWCRGYYVDTVGRNKKAVAEYIRNQLQEDTSNDQVSMKEYYDPFTGEKYFGGKKIRPL